MLRSGNLMRQFCTNLAPQKLLAASLRRFCTESIPLITLKSGLMYRDIYTPDDNAEIAEPNKLVSVHYTGRLEDGTVFDSSIERRTPISFTIGKREVIKGWEEGVYGMKVSGKRQLVIPPHLGYGAQGVGPIPPNALLHFDVELVSCGHAPQGLFDRFVSLLKALK